MNFKEWREGVQGLQTKLERGTLYDISEVIGVGGTTIAITLGKNGLKVGIGDVEDVPYNSLRPYYTPNKEEFGDILDVLTERVKDAVESTESLLTEVVAPVIPEAVLSRIKGSTMGDADNKDLLGMMVVKAWEELKAILVEFPTPFRDYSFEFEPIKDKDFSMSYFGGSHYYLSTCDFRFDTANPSTNVRDIETCLSFLANHDKIKKELVKFGERLGAF